MIETCPIQTQSGQSLVQVMVSIAIASIILVTISRIQMNAVRENQALTEKLAAVDLQRLVSSTLADGSVCAYQISLLGNQAFDPSLVTANTSPPPIDLGANLYAAASATAPAVASVGKPASPLSNTVIVQSIQLADIHCDAPCVPATSNVFTANLKVGFNGANLIRGIAPATTHVTLQTADVGGQKKIIGCMSSQSAAAGTPATGTWCGYRSASCNTSVVVYGVSIPCQGVLPTATCEADGIACDGCAGVTYVVTGWTGCPSGYSTVSNASQAFCVKN